MTGHDVADMRRRAAAHLEAAASLAPQRHDVRVRRAWVLLRQGLFDAAARDFDAVLAERQLDPDILNQVGFGLCHLGDLERAAAVMQRAFELNPFAPSDYHADFAVIQALRGDAEAAEEHFLVSGETGLQYDAVRIANFTGLAKAPPYRGDIEARFARGFIAAWQGEHRPRPEDVAQWISDTLPLRDPRHADFVTRGLEHRLRESWPAA
jgi:Tfp pilus assembly protein PilF